MCYHKAYTQRYPNGHREKSYRVEPCAENRMGLPCAETTASSHSRVTGYTNSPSYTYAEPYVPSPTPSYTPVMPATPTYPNGYESDRSYHSNGSSGSRRRRGSSMSYYPVDTNYLNAHTTYLPRDVPRRSDERVVIVENPPTPRTPPQSHNFAASAPSSPNFGMAVPYTTESSPLRRSSTRAQPIIVDERRNYPNVRIVEPPSGRSSKSHSRNTSTDSGHYSYAHSIPIATSANTSYTSSPASTSRAKFSSSPSKEEEKAQRRRAEEARQNAAINARSAVPRPMARANTYSAANAAEDFAKMNLGYEQRRAEKERRKAEKQEQDAMDARLRERLMPKRRFSVGTGTRRRMGYDEGLYRYD